MEYKRYKKHGLSIEIDDGNATISEIYSFLGGTTFPTEGINGLCRLRDESGYYDGANLEITDFREDENRVEIDFETPFTRYTAAFEYLGEGRWKRADRIKNLSKEESKIHSCLSRFVLTGGNFDILTQEGSWCGENETALKPINGNITLSNNGIRTAQDAQPFLCIKDRNQGYSLAFHLFPIGQWVINAVKRFSGETAMLVIDMGLNDNGLSLVLAPEEEISLPEIVFFRSEPGDFGFGSRKIHKYLLEKKAAQKSMPLLYNSWFLDFNNINPENLKKQLDAAANLGIEYFVVDSGWFGNKEEDWYNQCGIWEENTRINFKGKMKEFADRVREKGLKFGLWFEIERTTKNSDLYRENRELFFDIDEANALFDFSRPAARDKVFDIIKNTVKTYGVEFIKFDYNAALAYDPTGSSFYRYYSGWYSLMDRFREEMPEVFFECCSSGGLRTDPSSYLHYDSLFSSDTVHPLLTARIIDGAMLRLPPRAITKWISLREVSGIARRYYKNEKTDRRLLSATDGAWDLTIEIPIEFLEAYALVNGLGFTAKIDDYSEETTEKLRQIIDFWKEMRPFIEKATCAPLSMPKQNSNYDDDIVWQLSSIDDKEHVIAALHMGNHRNGLKIVPRNIDKNATYEISFVGVFRTKGFDKGYTVKGKELENEGIVLAFPESFTGRIAKITKKD